MLKIFDYSIDSKKVFKIIGSDILSQDAECLYTATIVFNLVSTENVFSLYKKNYVYKVPALS